MLGKLRFYAVSDPVRVRVVGFNNDIQLLICQLLDPVGICESFAYSSAFSSISIASRYSLSLERLATTAFKNAMPLSSGGSNLQPLAF